MEKKEIIEKKIYEMNQITQDSQIKGECLLRDLAKSIEFYNGKFG